MLHLQRMMTTSLNTYIYERSLREVANLTKDGNVTFTAGGTRTKI